MWLVGIDSDRLACRCSSVPLVTSSAFSSASSRASSRAERACAKSRSLRAIVGRSLACRVTLWAALAGSAAVPNCPFIVDHDTLCRLLCSWWRTAALCPMARVHSAYCSLISADALAALTIPPIGSRLASALRAHCSYWRSTRLLRAFHHYLCSHYLRENGHTAQRHRYPHRTASNSLVICCARRLAIHLCGHSFSDA